MISAQSVSIRPSERKRMKNGRMSAQARRHPGHHQPPQCAAHDAALAVAGIGVAGKRAEREIDQGDARGDDQAVEDGEWNAGRLDARLSVLNPAREEYEAVIFDRQRIGDDGRRCPHQGRRWGQAHDEQPDKRAERPAKDQNGHDCQRHALERAAGGRRNQAAARTDRQLLQSCCDVITGACNHFGQGPAQALFRLLANRCPGLGLRREQQLQVYAGENQTEDGEHEQDGGAEFETATPARSGLPSRERQANA